MLRLEKIALGGVEKSEEDKEGWCCAASRMIFLRGYLGGANMAEFRRKSNYTAEFVQENEIERGKQISNLYR